MKPSDKFIQDAKSIHLELADVYDLDLDFAGQLMYDENPYDPWRCPTKCSCGHEAVTLHCDGGMMILVACTNPDCPNYVTNGDIWKRGATGNHIWKAHDRWEKLVAEQGAKHG